MAEEEEWYDVYMRRPDDDRMHQKAEERKLPAPTELFTSIYPQAGRDGEDIKLAFKGYSKDSEEAMISSGLTQWRASDVLCNYLLNDDDIDIKESLSMVGLQFDLLELGSGIGKCGLLAHLLLQTKDTTRGNAYHTVLTDGDTNAMRFLQRNVAFNTTDDEKISCQKLVWGEDEAEAFLQQNRRSFDLIIGSDLLQIPQMLENHRSEGYYYVYNRIVNDLFDTVKILGTTFILAHDEELSIPVDIVIAEAAKRYFFYEVLKQEGSVYLLRFRRTKTLRVNRMASRFHAKNTLLEDENRALKARLQLVEDKCLKLDERCTFLRDDASLPKSILISFDEDNLAIILSFLEPKDFAQLASTCKRFGLRKHAIGIEEEPVSLMKKIAYKIYEGASPEEKGSILYQRSDSPFYLYNELNKLRKPLKFDRLFGDWDIQHAADDESIIEPKKRFGGAELSEDDFPACTAVSEHVMRAGKHYVTFTCCQQSGDPLWLGVVRPLKQFKHTKSLDESPHPSPSQSLFTPFNAYWLDDLLELQCPEWDSNIHACVYKAIDGHCQWTDWGDIGGEFDLTTWTWPGMQSFEGFGKIGLLLDCDEGTLTVYKNDIRLGIMKEGLSGTYCWMVSVGSRWFIPNEDRRPTIKIERGSPPETVKDGVPQEKRQRIE